MTKPCKTKIDDNTRIYKMDQLDILYESCKNNAKILKELINKRSKDANEMIFIGHNSKVSLMITRANMYDSCEIHTSLFLTSGVQDIIKYYLCEQEMSFANTTMHMKFCIYFYTIAADLLVHCHNIDERQRINELLKHALKPFWPIQEFVKKDEYTKDEFMNVMMAFKMAPRCYRPIDGYMELAARFLENDDKENFNLVIKRCKKCLKEILTTRHLKIIFDPVI